MIQTIQDTITAVAATPTLRHFPRQHSRPVPRARKSEHSKDTDERPHLSGASIEDSVDEGHDGCFQVHFIPVSAQTPVQLVQEGLDGKAGPKRREGSGSYRSRLTPLLPPFQPPRMLHSFSVPDLSNSSQTFSKLTFSKKRPLPLHISAPVLPYSSPTQPWGLALFCWVMPKCCFSTLQLFIAHQPSISMGSTNPTLKHKYIHIYFIFQKDSKSKI